MQGASATPSRLKFPSEEEERNRTDWVLKFWASKKKFLKNTITMHTRVVQNHGSMRPSPRQDVGLFV